MPTNGIVLAGAAALGAYEVGVLEHVVTRVLPEAGCRIDVITGTSAGAINAAAFGAYADRPDVAIELLVREWSQLELGRLLRPSSVEVLSMLLDVSGVPGRLRRALTIRVARGGILDPAPIARVIERIPFDRLARQVAAGRVRIAISATRVANGDSVVFFDGLGQRPWHTADTARTIATPIEARHVEASAAIPLLLPAVAIDGEPYCDGGLRQNVPLSPAVHFGAHRLLVIDPLTAPSGEAPPHPATTTSPLFLAGKALTALFADRLAADLAQLDHTTAVLRAGRRAFGPGFEQALDRQLIADGQAPIHEIDALCIGPSRALGTLAAEYVTGPTFRARASGAPGHLLRCIVDDDPARAGDLLGFLLFDGGFTSELIALGRRDAAARHTELVELFAPVPGQAAASA